MHLEFTKHFDWMLNAVCDQSTECCNLSPRQILVFPTNVVGANMPLPDNCRFASNNSGIDR